MSNIFNRFSKNPVNLDMPRSKFLRNQRHKTTMNAGKLVPIYVEEVLPGDTHTLKTAMSVRMSTPIHPVFDDSFIDVYYFFVPNRLVWEHWEEFLGANKSGPWAQNTEYEIPQMRLNGQYKRVDPMTLADYFGIPVGLNADITFNALPFRAYQLIWNEWFRDENLQTPAYINTGDSITDIVTLGVQPADDVEFWTNSNFSGACYPVCKFPDYFTTALPMPQKGNPVEISLVDDDLWLPLNADSSDFSTMDSNLQFFNGDMITLDAGDTSNGGVALPKNTLAVSINDLRTAFQVQKWLEKSARGGSRYIEYIKAHFGVTSQDARLQRPEYIGGHRSKVTVLQVAQTSATDEVSPQGNVSAYSLTLDKSDDYTYSATEHGYILGVACIRTKQTYQQGLEKMWSRKTKFDFYDPVFANIGEQPVLEKEIYAMSNVTNLGENVFGYQEAWAEYRYKPDRISGQFRSQVNASLDTWHYAEEYTSAPTLSNKFIIQSKAPVERSLAVQNEPQFLCDFLVSDTAVRPMPMYSVPGLVDHH